MTRLVSLAVLVFIGKLTALGDDIDENFFLSMVRRAQSTPGVIAHSRSGQFVIARAPISGPAPARNTSSAMPNVRWLVPDLLAVSCERIRHLLLNELGIPEAPGNKILIVIQPPRAGFPSMDLAAKRFASGWNYQLTVSQQIEEEKVVRGIVQALLIELANRRAGERSCEIPLWLSEGLTQRILATAEADLVLQPEPGVGERPLAGDRNSVPLLRYDGPIHQGIKREPLFSAHRRLTANAPFSFTELSLPGPPQLEGGWEIYQNCSQLLVQRLLSLRDGRAKVRKMLALLPQCLNWQTAFLRSFDAEFASMLEVEKWWALMLASFTGRDQWQAWPRAASIEKLNQTLQITAQFHATTNSFPARAAMTPQQVVQTMDFVTQKTFLNRTVRQLDALRPRLFPELAPLLDEYRATLDAYLETRGRSGFALDGRGKTTQSVKLMVKQAVRQLDALDRQRAVWQEQANAEPKEVRAQ